MSWQYWPHENPQMLHLGANNREQSAPKRGPGYAAPVAWRDSENGARKGIAPQQKMIKNAMKPQVNSSEAEVRHQGLEPRTR